MEKHIEGRLQQLEARQLALRQILVALIDKLTVGMTDQERTESITRLFNIATDAVELASAADLAPVWILASARREVLEVARMLLSMGAVEA
ncbi:MAG: hypothetical protein KBC46_03560 [Ferrovibrio sp.]|nr:hypothetical protein [Ferrovibrio sp.]